MKNTAFLPCLLAIAGLASCGGGTSMQPPAATPTPSNPSSAMNGNFSFTATSQVNASNVIFIGGPLQSDSGGIVSGTLGISNLQSSCLPLGTSAAFRGSVNSQNVLMLLSAPIAGQVISFTATALSNGTFADGTYTITGGCLTGDSGSLHAQHLLSGMYTGSVLINGNSIGVSINFNAPTFPDATGAFGIRATGTFSNSTPCGMSPSLATEGGSEAGLSVSFKMASGVNPVVSFAGSTADGSSTILTGMLGLTGGPCDQMAGAITLSK